MFPCLWYLCPEVFLTYLLMFQRGAAMSSTAAASGFVVFLLSAQVIQSQDGWGVTYTPPELCAVRGSAVELLCTYTHPSRIQPRDISNTLWFTEEEHGDPVDLEQDSEYAGRVEYRCSEKRCSLRIKNLRESDSAEYKFMFMTNQPDEKYTGSPGVTLSVTDLQVKVSRSDSTLLELTCHSSCVLPDHQTYDWYKNELKVWTRSSSSYFVSSGSPNKYSCGLSGLEDLRSPSVCPDLQVKVSRSDSTLLELTCHSSCVLPDHQTYFWYKNELKIWTRSSYYSVSSGSPDKYSCGLSGLEGLRSPSVYGPRLPSVSVSPSEIVEGSSVTLSCSSDANPAANYTWYKKNQPRPHGEEPQLVFSSIQSSDSGQYLCEAENHLGKKRSEFISIDVKYGPRLPSVSVSPSEIVEGSSVTLTCSSDANPAASYTWYKKNQPRPHGEEPQLVFSSIQSSDSRQYLCEAENHLGKKRSEFISIDVKYGPRLPSVSVSPSEIVEGSSVTLTCSSDANPAASYTWYKKNQPRPHGEEPQLVFSSIQSSDSGQYLCEAENHLGTKRSKFISIDVKYGPRLPSVSVSPSEIVEGSSVTLTCSSDANPAANYTWYKEDEDSPTASGQIFIINDFRAEHSGSYSCEAQNNRGRSTSTFHLTVADTTTMIIHITRLTLVVVVPVSLLLLCLWMRKKKALISTTEPHEPIETVELDLYPVYEDVSDMAAQTGDTEEQEDRV
ncbi:carcinoembryonic antigen-related cell adhesion molecule 5-like isoform X3 [Cyclopterus lumpus]|uniref:carcinoembryonic antigen-related cell adhesion molecule 5-like isoform X3 n=1 Tax=Cyclopterus lumpus TaxID=8103 RepID=UPI001487150D|nr:carcinoembryonic antigen-related cell adhesion molecule 5-like isoform X3 [Cyclopterus lumpus]